MICEIHTTQKNRNSYKNLKVNGMRSVRKSTCDFMKRISKLTESRHRSTVAEQFETSNRKHNWAWKSSKDENPKTCARLKSNEKVLAKKKLTRNISWSGNYEQNGIT